MKPSKRKLLRSVAVNGTFRLNSQMSVLVLLHHFQNNSLVIDINSDSYEDAFLLSSDYSVIETDSFISHRNVLNTVLIGESL